MLKIMTLWNGKSFYFHSSQEARLLHKELHARTVQLKSSVAGAAKYCNEAIPALWARTKLHKTTGAGHADK